MSVRGLSDLPRKNKREGANGIALRHGIRLRADGGGYNRGATHPVNAMLNYAYAVLIAQTQIRLIVEGYDPTIGIMHEKRALRGINPGFALDHMEPMRPVVDRAVLQLIDAVTFTGADFSIQHDGVCRMNPELARRVAQLALEHCEVSGRYSACLRPFRDARTDR
jgi:CRISPR/Cas system-associated endonuclease Cas1